MTTSTEIQENYDRDADFQQEERHLEDVVEWIDNRINDDGSHPVIAGDVKAADTIVQMKKEKRRELMDSRSNPYFGRIDYILDGDERIRTAYIGSFSSGITGIPDDLQPPVVHRNAPIARLYYNPAAGTFSVQGRPVRKASVYLKRFLTIDNAKLLEIDDALRLPPPSQPPGLPQPPIAPGQSTRTLNETLAGPRGDQMADVVQTIQPEQYEAIAATASPTLIVQGAAGSGKSLIGLYRIDFILSPFSDIGGLERPTPERVIMFGPSPAFLNYVSGLLPGLGVNRVRQMTVNDWLLGQFSARVTLSRDDKVFDDLMSNRRKSSQAQYDAHQFKGGLKMKRLMDNYVRYIVARTKRSALSHLREMPSVSAAELKRAISQAFSQHPQPNAARANLIENLAAQVARQNFQSAAARRGATRYDIFNRAKQDVESSLAFWKHIDFRTEYVSLMSDPNQILTFAQKGDIGLEDARLISESAAYTDKGQALGITDLAAALYLDYALNGFQSERFQHVVVDEAQDVSPLEVELMRMHCPSDSFTILGDLRQGLLPYKSITNWQSLAGLFNRDKVSRLESRLSYRSTKQITQYSNRVIQGLHGRTAKTPIAHIRPGRRPRLAPSKSAAAMRQAIANSVRELRRQPNVNSIAVLTKWRRTATEITNALLDAGITGVSEFKPGDIQQTDIIVSPIVLTKGLEFDAVIVANAGKINYNETDFDRMLLYLACTRARHDIHIHWWGPRSPIVPDTARLSR